jgi:hypothetical protein
MTRPAALAALAVTMLACSSSDDVTPSRASSPIVHGDADAGDGAVVALVERRASCPLGGAIPFCTGVLIAPDVVLTAAHCAVLHPAHDVEVFSGDDARDGGTFVAVSTARVHPSYDAATDAHDLALLRLATPLAATPATIARSGVDALVGATARVVGFGVDMPAGVAGPKREGDVSITAIDPELVTYAPSPSMTCSADSGGATFATIGGVEQLVAITRSGDAACATYGDAVRVDAYVDFIDPFVAAGADASVTPPADPSVDVCGTQCATDDDCPASMLCLADRAAGKRCGYASTRPGRFGTTCASAGECASGTCAPFGAGADASCRCWSPCGDVSTDATAADAIPDASNAVVEGGGGCAIERASSARARAWVAPIALAIAWLARRRVSGSCSRCRAGSPRPRRRRS